jgi:hypothetical protein
MLVLVYHKEENVRNAVLEAYYELYFRDHMSSEMKALYLIRFLLLNKFLINLVLPEVQL